MNAATKAKSKYGPAFIHGLIFPFSLTSQKQQRYQEQIIGENGFPIRSSLGEGDGCGDILSGVNSMIRSKVG
jgi:hypothetical protein